MSALPCYHQLTALREPISELRELTDDLHRLTWTYSHRRATTGSTLVARRAGSKQAIIATNVRTAATDRILAGSVGLTSNRNLPRTGVNASAPHTPTATPAATSDLSQ